MLLILFYFWRATVSFSATMPRVKTEPRAGTATRVRQHAKLVLRTRRVLYQNALLKAHVRRLQALLHLHGLCSCYGAPPA